MCHSFIHTGGSRASSLLPEMLSSFLLFSSDLLVGGADQLSQIAGLNGETLLSCSTSLQELSTLQAQQLGQKHHLLRQGKPTKSVTGFSYLQT